MVKKLLAVGIIILLVGVSIPSTGKLLEQSSPVSFDGITLYVGGSGPSNYTRIQDAINDANDGDTVFVYSGTYIENVEVGKSISLIGENKDTTIIDGNGIDDVVFVDADWVKISGFTIRNSGVGHGGIRISSNYNTITGNNISSNNAHGIRISRSSNNTITGNNISLNNEDGIHLYCSNDNTLTGNNISSNNKDGICLYDSSGSIITGNTMVDDVIRIRSLSGLFYDMLGYWNTHVIDTSNTVNGKPVIYWKNQIGGTIPIGAGQVILANCTNVVVEYQNIRGFGIVLGFSSGCIIIGNNISNNNRNSIYLYYSSDNIIEDNIISESEGKWSDGINLWYSNNNTIKGNKINSNNYRYGIKLYCSSNNIIIGNNISSNNRGGIFLYYYSNNNTIMGNNISSNNRHGIYIYFSSNNIIIGNKISSNIMDGIHLYFSNNNTIQKNNFIDNGRDVFFYNSLKDLLWSRNRLKQNYWNRPRIFPKLIPGTIYCWVNIPPYLLNITCFNIDWRPALRPYNI